MDFMDLGGFLWIWGGFYDFMDLGWILDAFSMDCIDLWWIYMDLGRISMDPGWIFHGFLSSRVDFHGSHFVDLG